MTHPGCGLKFLCVPHVCQGIGFATQWRFFCRLTTEWHKQNEFDQAQLRNCNNATSRGSPWPSPPPTSSLSAGPASSVDGFVLCCNLTQWQDYWDWKCENSLPTCGRNSITFHSILLAPVRFHSHRRQVKTVGEGSHLCSEVPLDPSKTKGEQKWTIVSLTVWLATWSLMLPFFTGAEDSK